MKKINEVVIVGSGLSGSVLARKLAEDNIKVKIYEKRSSVAGNVFDEKKEGIIVQKYGPHIFHTSKKNVIDFMKKYWELNEFKNVVECYVEDKLIPLPFNFKSIDICFPDDSEEIKNILKEEYPDLSSIPILELKKNKNELIRKLADFVYRNIFLNYTIKMWGLTPEEIDDSVTARIPIILSYYNRYFDDYVEGVPKGGFTSVIKKLLDHKNIEVNLDHDAIKNIEFHEENVSFKKEKNVLVIFTGHIDALFEYEFGHLDYRSLNIVFEKKKVSQFQKTAVVNYPSHESMTRITEYQNFYPESERKEYTYISKEFPGKYDVNDKVFFEPYYPLASEEARIKYNKYYDKSKKYKNLILLGRLAKFKYINMDQAIEESLNEYKNIVKEFIF